MMMEFALKLFLTMAFVIVMSGVIGLTISILFLTFNRKKNKLCTTKKTLPKMVNTITTKKEYLKNGWAVFR